MTRPVRARKWESNETYGHREKERERITVTIAVMAK